MGRVLFLLFTIVPLAELYLLFFLGQRIGFWQTVAIVLVTGLVGATLAKLEGLRALRSFQTALSQGRAPDETLTSGLLILVGGALLITPGVITDIAGLFLLVPWSRRWIARRLQGKFSSMASNGQVHFSRTVVVGSNVYREPPIQGRVIDVEAQVPSRRIHPDQ